MTTDQGLAATPLPCPFCGHAPLVFERQISSTTQRVAIECCNRSQCPCAPVTVGFSIEHACKRWNTRAPFVVPA